MSSIVVTFADERQKNEFRHRIEQPLGDRMPSVLFTFNDQEHRDEFLRAVRIAADFLPESNKSIPDNAPADRSANNYYEPLLTSPPNFPYRQLIHSCLDNAAIFDRTVDSREVQQAQSSCCGAGSQAPKATPQSQEKHLLFVSGKHMAEGTLPEMKDLFSREVTQHSGSVEVRAWRNNQWETILRRPRSEG